MWPTASSRSRFGVSIFALSVLLFLLASQPSSAAPRVTHPRISRAAPKTRAPAQRGTPTAETPNYANDVLLRLQDGQTTLAKQTADFNTAVQRKMNQVSAEVGDSQRATQLVLEQTNQHIDSVNRLLKFVLTLLVLSLGGLLYAARRLSKLQGTSVKWKGKIPEPDAEDHGIVSWRSSEAANGPIRKPQIKKDTDVPPPAALTGIGTAGGSPARLLRSEQRGSPEADDRAQSSSSPGSPKIGSRVIDNVKASGRRETEQREQKQPRPLYGTRDMHAASRVGCEECSRPIHWWNRRLWLDDEHCAHLRCYQSRLFMKALLAEQSGSSQRFDNKPQPYYCDSPERSDNGFANDVPPSVPSATTPILRTQLQT
jgi:hypothetical protein